jgi:hypothetical protein
MTDVPPLSPADEPAEKAAPPAAPYPRVRLLLAALRVITILSIGIGIICFFGLCMSLHPAARSSAPAIGYTLIGCCCCAVGSFLLRHIIIFLVLCKYTIGQMMAAMLVTSLAMSLALSLDGDGRKVAIGMICVALTIVLLAFTFTYDPRGDTYIPEFVRQQRRRQRAERRRLEKLENEKQR